MCADCEAARTTGGHWRMYDPLCLWCGARLLQVIRGLPMVDRASKTARMKRVLVDWVSYGHSEKALRAMEAEGSMPLAPRGEPARQPKTKPR